MAVNLPKIADTPYLSLYSNSTKQNDVTMTFPVNSSFQCFRTAALSMVTLNNYGVTKSYGACECRKPLKNVKILRCQWVKPYAPKRPKNQNSIKSQISFCKILKNKWYHAKVLPKRFHLNGHTIGFHPQTQTLELYYMSP